MCANRRRESVRRMWMRAESTPLRDRIEVADMRLGRVVFLAGLAPLLGFAASLSADPGAVNQAAAMQAPDSLASLLRTVVVLVSADADATPQRVGEFRASPQFVFELTALAHTPLRHSLWLVTNPVAGGLPYRNPLILQLRC